MTIPVENGAALFTTEAVAVGDVVSAALRFDNTGNNLGVRICTSGGVITANGFTFDVDGRLLVVDATAGIPAGSVASNGLLFSAGALCISSNAMATVQNGVPLDVNGAVVVSPMLLAMLVLRKYGTDAHLYLPGVGYLNGVDAGNWLDTAFAPTAQDQPVGLAMDAANTQRGPELVTNGDFSNGTTQWFGSGGATIAVVGGELEVTNGTGAGSEQGQQILMNVDAGIYELTVSCRRGTATYMQFGIEQVATYFFSTALANTALVTYRQLFTIPAGSPTSPVIKLRASGPIGGTAYFDSVSLRKIPGAIPASNNTTAQKPIVRRVPILGPELPIKAGSAWVNNGDGSYTRATTAWNGIGAAIPGALGRSFVISVTVGSITSGSTLRWVRRNAADTNNELESFSIVAGGTYTKTVTPVVEQLDLDVWVDEVGFSGTLSSISVREIIGYTNQWYWEFAAPDRLILSALPFVATDDYCVGVAVDAPATGALQTVFEVGSGAYARACSIRHSGFGWQCVWADAAAVVLPSSTPAKSGPVVVSARKIGNVVSMVEDGTINRGSAAPPGGATAMTQAVIGARSSNADFLTGNFNGQYIIKGTVPDADRLTLDRMLAGLQGRTI